MLSRARTALVALATTLAAVLSVSIGLPSAAHAATSGTPQVGQCHQLTYRQAWAMSDAKRPVSCTARHDLQTIAVVMSPTSLAGLSDDQLSDASSACSPVFNRIVGRPMTKLAITAYRLWSFVPTAAQRAAGARWIRCDVALSAGSGIAPLPRHRLPRTVLPAHVTDSVRACLTSKKWMTTCSRKHAFRAMKAFAIHQAPYPTHDQFVAQVERRCPSGWNYADWANERGWSHGWRVVTCYDKTRK